MVDDQRHREEIPGVGVDEQNLLQLSGRGSRSRDSSTIGCCRSGLGIIKLAAAHQQRQQTQAGQKNGRRHGARTA